MIDDESCKDGGEDDGQDLVSQEQDDDDDHDPDKDEDWDVVPPVTGRAEQIGGGLHTAPPSLARPLDTTHNLDTAR